MLVVLIDHPHGQEVPVLTIASALERIKSELDQLVPEALLRRLLRDLGRPRRERVLPPSVTTGLFLQQVLHGNTAITHLRHLSGRDFTASAYCQARGRLPVEFFRRLSGAVVERCRHEEPPRLWRGLRLVLIDGTSFSMPDTDELRETFGQPTGQADGCGFPVAHLLAVVEADTGYLLKARLAPMSTHDSKALAGADAVLQGGDLVLGDRAFDSFAHLARLRRRGIHALFRLHQRQIVSFRPHRRHATPDMSDAEARGLPRSRFVKRLGKHDQIVEYVKPTRRPDWMSAADDAALPEALRVRELRFRTGVPGCRTRTITVVTTLLDANRYPAKALARLYRRRWQIEVDLRHLKQTLRMDVLHCQTVPGVVKELLMFVTVYNLVRRVMARAARRQGVPPRRISFIDALRWLRCARPEQPMPPLLVVEERPIRFEPRVRKRRPKQYPLMTRPRAELKQELRRNQLAA
jgi:Transposase DDE domain